MAAKRKKSTKKKATKSVAAKTPGARKKKAARKKKGARKKTGGRKYSAGASKKVGRALSEEKSGTLRSGRSRKKVTSRKQAIAIGLNEARKKGAKVPRKKKA